MKLSEKIEAMFWAFNDAHRVGEARSLAREAQAMEVELDRLRAMEERLKEPSVVLDTGLDAKPYSPQVGKIVAMLPPFQVTPEEWLEAVSAGPASPILESLNKVLAKRSGAEKSRTLHVSTHEADDLRRRVARLERDNTFLWQGLDIDYAGNALGTGQRVSVDTRRLAMERDGG